MSSEELRADCFRLSAMDLNLEYLKMISVVMPINRYENWTMSAISSCLLGGEPIELILVLSKSLMADSKKFSRI